METLSVGRASAAGRMRQDYPWIPCKSCLSARIHTYETRRCINTWLKPTLLGKQRWRTPGTCSEPSEVWHLAPFQVLVASTNLSDPRELKEAPSAQAWLVQRDMKTNVPRDAHATAGEPGPQSNKSCIWLLDPPTLSFLSRVTAGFNCRFWKCSARITSGTCRTALEAFIWNTMMCKGIASDGV